MRITNLADNIILYNDHPSLAFAAIRSKAIVFILFFALTMLTMINILVFRVILVCDVLSYQRRVTVTVMSCFAYKVIRYLESIDHLCINPILWIGLIHK